MNETVSLVGKIFSDKPLAWLVNAGAYLLLILAVYRRPGNDTLMIVVVAGIAISLLLFIIRLVILLACRKTAAKTDSGKLAYAMEKGKSSLTAAAYVVLIGLIIEPYMDNMAILYALAALFAVTFAVTLFGALVKDRQRS